MLVTVSSSSRMMWLSTAMAVSSGSSCGSTTMEKTTQRFQKIATTVADLNAEGLNVQTVNDPLTMYVGAASQHVLRMSFVSEQEARQLRQTGYDLLVSPYASRYHLSVVFSTPQACRTWSGLCTSTPRGSQMARVAVDHSHVDGNNPVTGHRFPLQLNTTTTRSNLHNSKLPFPNK